MRPIVGELAGGAGEIGEGVDRPDVVNLTRDRSRDSVCEDGRLRNAGQTLPGLLG